jgi:hypothetical protein
MWMWEMVEGSIVVGRQRMGRIKWVRDGNRVHCHVSGHKGRITMGHGGDWRLRMGKRLPIPKGIAHGAKVGWDAGSFRSLLVGAFHVVADRDDL